MRRVNVILPPCWVGQRGVIESALHKTLSWTPPEDHLHSFFRFSIMEGGAFFLFFWDIITLWLIAGRWGDTRLLGCLDELLHNVEKKKRKKNVQEPVALHMVRAISEAAFDAGRWRTERTEEMKAERVGAERKKKKRRKGGSRWGPPLKRRLDFLLNMVL